MQTRFPGRALPPVFDANGNLVTPEPKPPGGDPVRALDRDPEPPLDREPPERLTNPASIIGWALASIGAHAVLRAKSFYDTGHLIGKLLELKAHFGAANIKELVINLKLGMSHMTANKYWMIARTFSRKDAVSYGIEKCYALIAYSKVIGRPGEAATILGQNEKIRGARDVFAREATAAQILRAIHALKQAARDSKDPSEARVAYERTEATCEKVLRKIGIKGADAHVTRRGGQLVMLVSIPLEVAESLTERIPRAFARFGPALAKTQPELFEPLREAGWKPRIRRTG